MSRLARYEARTDHWLTALALLFLLVYGVPIVWPGLPPRAQAAFAAANVIIWGVFALDLAARVGLAERRWQYLLAHPVDVLVVVLPLLRPLRVLRIFTAGQALLTRGRGLLRSGEAIVFGAGLLVLIGALAALDAERGAPEANIADFADALWWAITTVTTVGYGDRYPVTDTGRVVAAALMIVGISLVGLVTATVASWFLAQEQREAEDTAALTARIASLEAKIDRLVAERGEKAN